MKRVALLIVALMVLLTAGADGHTQQAKILDSTGGLWVLRRGTLYYAGESGVAPQPSTHTQ